MLHQFLAIYKYAYGKEFKTDSYFLDITARTLRFYIKAICRSYES